MKKIRVILAKPGLDGHDRGMAIVARALRDAGMEVIYLGLHQPPEAIVRAALEEDADVIALSVLSAAHMALFKKTLSLMKTYGLKNVLLTGGGIIPEKDKAKLRAMGVGQLFDPGTPTEKITTYIRNTCLKGTKASGWLA